LLYYKTVEVKNISSLNVRGITNCQHIFSRLVIPAFARILLTKTTKKDAQSERKFITVLL